MTRSSASSSMDCTVCRCVASSVLLVTLSNLATVSSSDQYEILSRETTDSEALEVERWRGVRSSVFSRHCTHAAIGEEMDLLPPLACAKKRQSWKASSSVGPTTPQLGRWRTNSAFMCSSQQNLSKVPWSSSPLLAEKRCRFTKLMICRSLRKSRWLYSCRHDSEIEMPKAREAAEQKAWNDSLGTTNPFAVSSPIQESTYRKQRRLLLCISAFVCLIWCLHDSEQLTYFIAQVTCLQTHHRSCANKMATAHAALYKNRRRPTPIAKAKETLHGGMKGMLWCTWLMLCFNVILSFSFTETSPRRGVA